MPGQAQSSGLELTHHCAPRPRHHSRGFPAALESTETGAEGSSLDLPDSKRHFYIGTNDRNITVMITPTWGHSTLQNMPNLALNKKKTSSSLSNLLASIVDCDSMYLTRPNTGQGASIRLLRSGASVGRSVGVLVRAAGVQAFTRQLEAAHDAVGVQAGVTGPPQVRQGRGRVAT